uniref:Ig-like domain-containing protein n=1 Tax=Spermophilus dauricus TaxID=99837 RepID=A0A8C9QDR8_SPEDA
GLKIALSLLFSFQAGVRGQQVEQSPSALRLQEGNSTTLRCNFSTTMNRVQWFQQNPGGSLRSLFFLTSGTKQEGRLKATADAKERYSTLHISTSQLEDSGTYLCAMRHSAPRGSAACHQTAAAPAASFCLREGLPSSLCTTKGVLIHVIALSPLLTGDSSALSSHTDCTLSLP